MPMVKFLQQRQLIVYHLLVTFDILLENDFHSDLFGRPVCFANNSIGTCTLIPVNDVSDGYHLPHFEKGKKKKQGILRCGPFCTVT